MSVARSRFGWWGEVISLEIRSVFAYRATFWVQFLGSLATIMIVAYYLWGAIYEARGTETLGGYTFHGMLLYYVVVGLAQRMQHGDHYGQLADAIYSGALTRFLVYPISFFTYKWAQFLAEFLIYSQQLLLGIGIFFIFFPVPPEVPISVLSIVQGLLALLAAGYVYFFFTAMVEMFAFWVDNTWTMVVMVRIIASTLGGGMFPMTLFPEWARTVLEFTPFPYFVGFPVEAIFGKLGMLQWAGMMVVTVCWGLFFQLITRAIFERGRYQYTGVGI